MRNQSKPKCFHCCMVHFIWLYVLYVSFKHQIYITNITFNQYSKIIPNPFITLQSAPTYHSLKYGFSQERSKILNFIIFDEKQAIRVSLMYVVYTIFHQYQKNYHI